MTLRIDSFMHGKYFQNGRLKGDNNKKNPQAACSEHIRQALTADRNVIGHPGS
jgi:hypothetical protein